MAAKDTVIRVAAVGDVHCSRTSQGILQPLFAQAAERTDVLLLCGDLTDYGLEEPFTRYSVHAVVHGHAHGGNPEGRTSGDIPVYNESLPLLQRAFPKQPAFRVLELSVAG
jgi:hypothetical protein